MATRASVTEVPFEDVVRPGEQELPAVGDFARLHPWYGTQKARALVYRVDSVKDGRAVASPVTGGQPTRVDLVGLIRVAPDSPEGRAAALLAEKHAGAPEVFAGALVRVDPEKLRRFSDATGLYVVLDVKLSEVKLAKLGGDGGRYWNKIPVSALTVVDPAILHA